jgi:hypothetical protein
VCTVELPKGGKAMSKRTIVIEIDAEAEHCGRLCPQRTFGGCNLFAGLVQTEEVGGWTEHIRLPACKAAEAATPAAPEKG